jgi:hypothetical protein
MHRLTAPVLRGHFCCGARLPEASPRSPRPTHPTREPSAPILRAAKGGKCGLALTAELPRIEAYDGFVRGELEYAMSASSSKPSLQQIGILMSRKGRFLECMDCHLTVEFPIGAHYDETVKQFESHLCSSPIPSKDDRRLKTGVTHCPIFRLYWGHLTAPSSSSFIGTPHPGQNHWPPKR